MYVNSSGNGTADRGSGADGQTRSADHFSFGCSTGIWKMPHLSSVWGSTCSPPAGIRSTDRKDQFLYIGKVKITPIVRRRTAKKYPLRNRKCQECRIGTGVGDDLQRSGHESGADAGVKSVFYRGTEENRPYRDPWSDGRGGAPHIIQCGDRGIRSEVLLHVEKKGSMYLPGSVCASNHPAISGVLKGIRRAGISGRNTSVQYVGVYDERRN